MTLQYIEEPHRHKILYNGRLLTAYNKTQLQFGDFGKPVPDFEPVHTLAGLPVTTTGAANFHHHKSIFLALKLNGHNFYHHNYPPLAPYGSFPYGDIGIVELSVQCDGQQVVIKSRNDWTNTYDIPDELRHLQGDPAHRTDHYRMCTETRDMRLALGDHNYYTLDIASTFHASDGPVHFMEDGHSYLTVRVADAIDEEDGGVVMDDTGRTGCETLYGQAVNWVDNSGIMAGHKIGIAAMSHPSNLRHLFRTRAYGGIVVSPFLDTDHDLQAGKVLRFLYRIVVHDGDADDVDLAGLFNDFTRWDGGV